jgi:hypothetical protein
MILCHRHLAFNLICRARHQGTMHQMNQGEPRERQHDGDGQHEEQRQSRSN